jgi:hypothetical protein
MKKKNLLLILVALLLVIPFEPSARPRRLAASKVRPTTRYPGSVRSSLPTNAANTVIIATLSPLAGFISPSTFNADAKYEILVDNTSDAIQTLALS